MDPLAALLHIMWMVALPCLLSAATLAYLNHGELWRPMAGYLLFRKPKIGRGVDTMLLFKVGNHGEHVRSFADLEHSHRRLERFIKKNSWFRRTDLARLMDHYELMWNAIYRHEQRIAREREYEQWKKQQQQKQQKQKPNQNAPISEWRRILGVDAHCRDPKAIKEQYRRLVSKEHPDKGGSGKRMPEFNRALDTARNELGFV